MAVAFTFLAGVFFAFASSPNYGIILTASAIFCLVSMIAFYCVSSKASAGMRWGSRLGIAKYWASPRLC
jgi:hypothetical protein